jgi:hypothetical protein
MDERCLASVISVALPSAPLKDSLERRRMITEGAPPANSRAFTRLRALSGLKPQQDIIKQTERSEHG